MFFLNQGAGSGTLTLSGTTFNVFALDTSLAEGDSGTTTFSFQVNRLGDTTGAASVDLAIAGSGANAADAADFDGGALPALQTVNFADGETTKTVSINVAGDLIAEPEEGFSATISNAVGGALGSSTTADATISNDDTSLSIAAADADRAELDSGLAGFTFIVTRTGDTSGTTDFGFGLLGSGANPANGADFIGSLPFGEGTFSVGETTKTLFIPVAGDLDGEADEEFTVFLLGATGGANIDPLNNSAIGIIRADDTEFVLSVDETSQIEGDTGTIAMTFKIDRLGINTGANDVTIDIAGSGGSPADNNDFAAALPTAQLVNFAAGETSKTVVVNIAGDTFLEGDDQITATLSGATGGAIIGVASVSVDVLEDEITLGSDIITGTSGNDTIAALDGNDQLLGLAGDDNLDGGEGSDTASYENDTGAITIDLRDEGLAQATGGSGTDTLTSFQAATTMIC